eukprot:359101-Chlamydomonas_euryale.AAC.1
MRTLARASVAAGRLLPAVATAAAAAAAAGGVVCHGGLRWLPAAVAHAVFPRHERPQPLEKRVGRQRIRRCSGAASSAATAVAAAAVAAAAAAAAAAVVAAWRVGDGRRLCHRRLDSGGDVGLRSGSGGASSRRSLDAAMPTIHLSQRGAGGAAGVAVSGTASVGISHTASVAASNTASVAAAGCLATSLNGVTGASVPVAAIPRLRGCHRRERGCDRRCDAGAIAAAASAASADLAVGEVQNIVEPSVAAAARLDAVQD